MSTEKKIETTEALRAVLDQISFKPSCVNMGWQWKVAHVSPSAFRQPPQPSSILGWLVSTTFRRPDTDTGVIGEGEGRKEFIAVGTTVSGVVKTCWLLAELVVRHELMESFCWKGERVFDPHKTVEALTRNEPRAQARPRITVPYMRDLPRPSTMPDGQDVLVQDLRQVFTALGGVWILNATKTSELK